MSVSSTKFDIVAKTFFGLEDVLAKEVENLGAEDIKKETRAVIFKGDKKLLYSSNYNLRTATKILKPIHKFNAKNEVELYKHVDEIDWTELLSRGDTLTVNTVLNSAHFGHSQFISQKVKDAVVDQLRKKTGRRPSVDTKDPTLRIHIHINQESCTLSLDSSGESLHKRGYRVDGHVAPINEILAAGMVLLSGWDKKSAFYDFMCGSGTILIEAALIANNIAPGIFRNDFAFEKWKDFDEDLFQEAYDDLTETNFENEIIGSDYSAKSASLARLNVKRASLDKKIKVHVKSFFDILPENKGTLIMNPPYGERIGGGNLNNFYKKIGDKLKKDFDGYNAWIISSNMDALKNIGLHTSKKITLYNGNLECKFNKYAMYRGSQKRKTKNTNPVKNYPQDANTLKNYEK